MQTRYRTRCKRDANSSECESAQPTSCLNGSREPSYNGPGRPLRPASRCPKPACRPLLGRIPGQPGRFGVWFAAWSKVLRYFDPFFAFLKPCKFDLSRLFSITYIHSGRSAFPGQQAGSGRIVKKEVKPI